MMKLPAVMVAALLATVSLPGWAQAQPATPAQPAAPAKQDAATPRTGEPKAAKGKSKAKSEPKKKPSKGKPKSKSKAKGKTKKTQPK